MENQWKNVQLPENIFNAKLGVSNIQTGLNNQNITVVIFFQGKKSPQAQ